MIVHVTDYAKHQETVISRGAINFVADLVKQFGDRVKHLLQDRQDRQSELDSGDFPYLVKSSSAWKAAPLPEEVLDRRVEITGPVDRKMMINALNSGANVFMADIEDSNSPTWENVVQGQINLKDAFRKTISYTNDAGKQYKLNDKTAVLMVRPRGWHLVEKHFLLNGEPAPAALVDFGLLIYNNVGAFGKHLYLYLPKMESAAEAELWDDIFQYAESGFGLDKGAIRVTCLIETITAAFQMDDIIFALKDRIIGLNCGRWDYMFSFIKKFSKHPQFVLPDRAQVTMDKAFLDAYVKLLIQTCHKRGIHAMGGMAAYIPIKDDEEANTFALNSVAQDKLREVKAGHDGTWVAHPGLIKLAQEIFDEHMPTPNQIDKVQPDYVITEEMLLEVHQGTRTEKGLRHNIRVGIQYIESWLRGVGCVPLYNLMEDAATAELARAQVWQWVNHAVKIEDWWQPLSQEDFLSIACEELNNIRQEIGEEIFDKGRFREAFGLFIKLTISPVFEDFLTVSAYDLLK